MNGKKKCVKMYKVNGELINMVIHEKNIMQKVSNGCCITIDYILKLNRPNNYLFLPDLLKMVEIINDERILFESVVINERRAICPIKKYIINGQHFEYWRSQILHNTQEFLSFKSGYSQNIISQNENNKRASTRLELEDWVKMSNLPEEFFTNIGPVQIIDEEHFSFLRYTKEELERQNIINRIVQRIYNFPIVDLNKMDMITSNIIKSDTEKIRRSNEDE